MPCCRDVRPVVGPGRDGAAKAAGGRSELDQVMAATLHVAEEGIGQEPQLPADIAVREALAVVQLSQFGGEYPRVWTM